MTSICLLGASGSIGQQTIEVIEANALSFSLISFSVGKRSEIIPGILSKHNEVKYIYLCDKEKAKQYSKDFPLVTFLTGDDALCNIITLSNPDMVVNALVGFVGLLPSIRALEENRKLALANKESLIVGGEIINNLLKKGKGQLFPIDSEHSALWKCLKVSDENVDKLVITASGGSFRDLSREQLVNVTKEDALNHPTWKMGPKITIDSASMMNKTFELIEAYYLFGYQSDALEVVLHKESELHSAVKYKDGSYRGELNHPDMKNPIKFALFEGNIDFDTVTFDSFDELKELHFKPFDYQRYPLVSLAKTVIDKRGNLGAIINGSNEIAVRAFLNDEISFLDIEKVVFESVNRIPFSKVTSVKDLLEADSLARKIASEIIMEGKRK